MDRQTPPATAVSELIDRFGGRLFALGLRFCGDEDDAKDLVQDTFLLAFRKWDQFEGRSDPGTWLYRIAARVCQRRRRRRSGEPRVMEPLEKLLPSGEEMVVDVPSPDEGPLAAIERREAREAVEAALGKLPAHFRLPFVLKEILELPLKDVASALGLKEGTVKTRLHRGRLLVAKELRGSLRKTKAPPPDHSRQMCLDLLKAKQDSFDRGVPFPVPREELCLRCRSLFSTLDLGGETCRLLGEGALPETVKKMVLSEIGAEDSAESN